MKNIILILCLIAFSTGPKGQVPGTTNEQSATMEVSIPVGDLEMIDVTNSWGTIKVEPHDDASSIQLIAEYKNAGNKDLAEGLEKLKRKLKKGVYVISAPPTNSNGFESYDLTLRIPPQMNLKLVMKRGGEIMVNGISGSIDIVNQNGSTKVQEASSWVTVNNFNGEVQATFRDLSEVKASTLITFNGGIKVGLPEEGKANVVALTKKNGQTHSDLSIMTLRGKELKTVNPLPDHADYTGMKGKITGEGGSSIIAITHNGPINVVQNR